MKWLLFESFHLAQNHKLDVLIIAKMLKSQGEDVSIFDIFHEYNEDIVDGIPIIGNLILQSPMILGCYGSIRF